MWLRKGFRGEEGGRCGGGSDKCFCYGDGNDGEGRGEIASAWMFFVVMIVGEEVKLQVLLHCYGSRTGESVACCKTLFTA